MICISFWLMKSTFLTYSQRALILCSIFASQLVVVGRCFLFTAEICSRIWMNGKSVSLSKVFPYPNLILLLHKGKAANWTHSCLIPTTHSLAVMTNIICVIINMLFFLFLETTPSTCLHMDETKINNISKQSLKKSPVGPAGPCIFQQFDGAISWYMNPPFAVAEDNFLSSIYCSFQPINLATLCDFWIILS